jgi:hypothetical protein
LVAGRTDGRAGFLFHFQSHWCSRLVVDSVVVLHSNCSGHKSSSNAQQFYFLYTTHKRVLDNISFGSTIFGVSVINSVKWFLVNSIRRIMNTIRRW